MGRRLIVDSGVFMSIERGRLRASRVFVADDDLALSAVSVSELLLGVELAAPERQEGHRAYLAQILSSTEVVDLDARVAVAHAQLMAFTRRSGNPRGAHDLIIAASAVAAGRTVLTTDGKARFGELPGVSVISA